MNARDRRAKRRAAERQLGQKPAAVVYIANENVPPRAPSEFLYVTRSYSRKVNLGNYESMDLFCSLNLQCNPEDVGVKSEQAVEWCKNQVVADIKRFRTEMAPLPDPPARTPPKQSMPKSDANDPTPPWAAKDKPSPLQQKLNPGRPPKFSKRSKKWD